MMSLGSIEESNKYYLPIYNMFREWIISLGFVLSYDKHGGARVLHYDGASTTST